MQRWVAHPEHPVMQVEVESVTDPNGIDIGGLYVLEFDREMLDGVHLFGSEAEAKASLAGQLKALEPPAAPGE